MTRPLTERPVPGWIRAAAYAVPLCVLPSAVWRLHHLATTEPTAGCALMGWFEPYYVALLSLVSFGAALLTIGLVRPWGETFPRWIPGVGGRRVPVAAAVVPAAVGALLLCVPLVHSVLNPVFGYFAPPAVPAHCPGPPTGWAVTAAYAPLPLWPLLLAVVTYAYYRRRTR